ncbi:hypothetical protein ES703_28311 [subsurface metagenome]
MVKRPSIKGKGKKILFEESVKSREEKLEDEKVKVKKETKVVDIAGEREVENEKIKEAEVKIIKEKAFKEEHPLLTKEPFFKVSVCLSEKENEFLDLLGKKAKLTGGNKIPKNMIIRSFVKAFMDVELDTTGLKIKDDKILFEMVKSFVKK